MSHPPQPGLAQDMRTVLATSQPPKVRGINPPPGAITRLPRKELLRRQRRDTNPHPLRDISVPPCRHASALGEVVSSPLSRPQP